MIKKLLRQKSGAELNDTMLAGRTSHRLMLSCGITIFLITFLVYIPSLKNSFVNWDDYTYVSENMYIHSLNLQSFYWMLTSFHASNWHPLTWLSHGVDCALFGLKPFGHHLTSIILHGFNTLLVFLLATQLILKAQVHTKAPFTGSPYLPSQVLIAGVVTALLFGLHPVHVESVAWVAERKDVLCAFFYMLVLCSYLCYASAANRKNKRAWFTACIALAGAALTAKPMSVTLPLVLLLLDIYPLKRIDISTGTNQNRALFLEKIPFFTLSALSGVMTILAQHFGGAVASLDTLPLRYRLLNALYSPLFYLIKMSWPFGLVPAYPFPRSIHFFDLTYIISALLIVSASGWCIWMLRWGRYLFFTVWAYYLITLLPVLGIIQVGWQAAADRYTYLPSLSIFLLAGIGISQALTVRALTRNMKMFGGFIVVLIFTTAGLLTVQQIGFWRDSETLWKYVIKSFPGRVALAHNNLGVLYDRKGMYNKAFEEYEKAIAINPTFADAHNNLGAAYNRRGMYDKAIEVLEKAIAVNPALADAYSNLGVAYKRMGMYDKAIEEYKKAIASNPTHIEAHYNLGLAYYAHGMGDQAIKAYEKTLLINPALAAAHYQLGLAYYDKKDYTLARMHLDKARGLGYRIDPRFEAMLENRP